MKIEMKMNGLEELIKALEKSATEKEIQEINKRVVQRVQPEIEREMKKNMPVSHNQAISGRGFGSRSHPAGHAADNIPIEKISVSGTRAEGNVGWSKSDNSEHFYVKFINWGTVDREPQEFIYKAGRSVEGKIERIAEEEYQKYLNSTVR